MFVGFNQGPQDWLVDLALGVHKPDKGDGGAHGPGLTVLEDVLLFMDVVS